MFSMSSETNNLRMKAAFRGLASYIRSPHQSNPLEFYNLCLSLSRGTDYAVSNKQIPSNAQDLPSLLKQICQIKQDISSQAAIMVLVISMKSAARAGWFHRKESQEIVAIADEMGKKYNTGNITAGRPAYFHSTISTIMKRFYPKLKLGHILVSLEVKPGYGAFAMDFLISKDTPHSSKDEIRLLVAQTDNIDTSACIINPQQVNFLLNGSAVEGRINIQMDCGPQTPTNVTAMLKYGTNLLQVLGHFYGHYIIVVAFMNISSSPDNTNLQHYAQPPIPSLDSDCVIIEGPSQISLKCPISLTRIKTPIKGSSCKHFQCFDLNNYIEMNSRRPSWRCPYCNKHVSYQDIRLDQNMIQVLKEVGENIDEVVMHPDGSWKVLENDDYVMLDKMTLPDTDNETEIVESNFESEGSNSLQPDLHFESATSSSTYGFSSTLGEAERQKHFSQLAMKLPQVNLPSQAVTPNSIAGLSPTLSDAERQIYFSQL